MKPRYYRRTWLDDVKPGDVVRFKSGALRTVLTVSRYDGNNNRGRPHRMPAGLVYAVCFPILHCSWTKRGYTVFFRTELLTLGECLTRARVNLENYPAARALLRDIAYRHTGPLAKRVEDIVAHYEDGSSCCDVIGTFS